MDFDPDAGKNISARFKLSFPTSVKSSFILDVDLHLPGRGITAIFGYSGSGKTTLLRCVAGLQRADSGKLTVNDDVWQDENSFLPTHKRPLGYVFQEASLFPHLSAQGNLVYAMKRSGSERSLDHYQRVVELMGIEPFLHQFPNELSGGERQRVAIARALLVNPRLLLMDEPLAALDNARKEEILPYLERLHEQFDIPVLYVSHSVDEVARLADHLVILDAGKVAAQGSLIEVLSRIDLPVRLGEETGVVVEATVLERDSRWHLIRVGFAGGDLWVRDSGEAINQPLRIRVLAKDVSLALASHSDTSILNRLAAIVTEISSDTDDAMSLIRLKTGSITVIARVTRRSVDHLHLTVGCSVWAQIKSVAIVR